MGSHRRAGGTSTTMRRTSSRTAPPAQDGSPGSLHSAGGMRPASVQWVSVVSARRRARASRIASRGERSDCGTIARIASSWQTAGLRSPSARGRAMDAGTGVTRWIQYDESRGDRIGTGTMSRRRRPASSAYVRMSSRYVTTSGPPMSKVSPAVSGCSSTPSRYPSTLRIAMGWLGVPTHRGVTMAGRRSTRYRRISNDALPEPRIMAARSVVTGTGPSASTRPTSARERRCAERSGASSPSPPRYTMRSRPAAAAARTMFAAERRSASAKSPCRGFMPWTSQ